MRRFTCLLAVILAASCATAPARADDMTLRWDDCGASGTALEEFACDTNAGGSDLLVSFTVSAPRSLTGAEATMEVFYPAPGPVPSWWNLPACRPSAVIALVNGAGFGSCVSPWAPSVAGGVVFEPTYFGSAIGRLRAGVGVPPADSASLVAGVEYGALRIRISYAKTTGTGACTGCSLPAGIYLNSLDLFDSVYPQLTITPAPGDAPRYFVGWQCDGTPQFDHSSLSGWSFVNCTVAAKAPTWGRIKGLYR